MGKNALILWHKQRRLPVVPGEHGRRRGRVNMTVRTALRDVSYGCGTPAITGRGLTVLPIGFKQFFKQESKP
jgi:hypothetical protein